MGNLIIAEVQVMPVSLLTMLHQCRLEVVAVVHLLQSAGLPGQHNLRRTATARILDALSFTVSASQAESIARIAIAMGAVITLRTNPLERKRSPRS
jgi:hypothetical protein